MAQISVSHRYAQTPERVFDAWLDPRIARRFLFATPAGEMVVCEIDARVGGRFDLTERRPDMGEVKHVGEYLEVDRPRRLVFTFAVPQFDPTATRVAIDIVPETIAGGEGCVLTLTHTDVGDDWAEGTRDGWTKILASLEPALDGKQAAGWI
ncbi:SRPBCC family protein [Phenylobacterium soli]|uniref:SRPBCC domain-containing protein n=1 Tax=Phenylobacterium soli TaxID=2170551 RepID=A0A328AHX5_9CAUL|nr:SRPBCC family protein [Phenylobacterium soli]RAK54412.1 SRPBCC domain-containing protein [Phenylobacterium soli]